MSEEKIGMYTAEEILEFMTDGEGRGFMGRSMFDAIYFKIKDLQQKVEQLEKENKKLNNIINELEKELNKKKEAIKTIKDMLGEEAKIVNPHIEVLETEYKYFLEKLKELKDSD